MFAAVALGFHEKPLSLRATLFLAHGNAGMECLSRNRCVVLISKFEFAASSTLLQFTFSSMTDLLASDEKRRPILGGLDLEQPRPKEVGRRPGWSIFLLSLILYFAFWRPYNSGTEDIIVPTDSSVPLADDGFDWYKVGRYEQSP